MILVRQLTDFDEIPIALSKDLFPLKRRRLGALVLLYNVYTFGLFLNKTPKSVNNAMISYILLYQENTSRRSQKSICPYPRRSIHLLLIVPQTPKGNQMMKITSATP